jgi:hypothetical protein
MLVFQFHPEHGIGQRLNHRCHDFNCVFFAQITPFMEFSFAFSASRVPSPAARDSGFRLRAPAALTPAKRLNFAQSILSRQ